MAAIAVYQPTASQYASAASHLDRSSDWRHFWIDDTRYVSLTSGCSGKRYTVRADARGCSCLWSQKTGAPCSHRVALELAALEADLVEQPRPSCWTAGCDLEPEMGEGGCSQHMNVSAF